MRRIRAAFVHALDVMLLACAAIALAAAVLALAFLPRCHPAPPGSQPVLRATDTRI